ncbi:2-C-methyl-D-erythritol 4-phosphate cytidylyltransferase [Parabacteroides sp. PFB2-12]|uniref:2-C-methyl-D-erythritol 4-phosphate cytidylyltransferase n=1 Tax=unclassified Parabacteroides TaxID=2649774 RepID=UPI0024737B40|nr:MULTISPECIES: 2-C-methyl-D-erythritol 4-phosphate cytidylyltransferase [unclassified Parabacteroides]MDH6341319.1 2-C-methyl-D-erythritol 4-phosphate cytidylyltransferase [Parabacteroides sp. PM6-13]MDH6389113.1 2-C-methyl-D-erythritol 4-phosphate cytidylyltransferase [Parabacteroides sp. PFB2-12]
MERFIIIVAGGKGLRMGADLPKQFIPLDGKPLLMHTLEAFNRWDESAEIILVLPEDHQDYWRMLCKEIGTTITHVIVNGGETRFHSVKNGLKYIAEELGFSPERKKKALVAIHDGVRPFPSSEVIDNCFNSAEKEGNAIPVIPIVDSIRQVTEEGNFPMDRADFYAVQTPQVFHSDLIIEAYRQDYSPRFTDDASVAEAMGAAIHLVPGNRENIKITTPFDLLIAKAICPYCH